jgi:two-component system cell cycle sensor histidine kinase PleC
MAVGQLASFRIELALQRPQSRPATILVAGASLPNVAAGPRGTRPNGYVISLTDISSLRHHTEVEVRRHDALSQALEEMHAGLALFDAEDRLVFCNRTYREFYGIPAELSRPGTPFRDMLLDEVGRGQIEMNAEEQTRFVALRLERRKLQHAQGGAGGGDVSVIEQRNSDGRWLQIHERIMAGDWIVGVHVDATGLKSKEQALKAHIRELDEMRSELEVRTAELSQLASNLASARDAALGAARSKANFLANMSHELRTPLNAVIGFAEILAGGSAGTLTPQQTEYLGDIRSSGKHLLGVINDILDISKADAGKINLQEEEIELAELIRSTARLMQASARGKGLELRTEIPEALAHILVAIDVRRFRQVLLNLLSNAIKFTPSPGKVIISLETAVQNGLIVAVSDTGIGIADQDQSKVFSPFEQADSSLSRRFEGTGLGLALVKALIDLHHGKVDLESAPGVGTRVTIWLPPKRIRPAR